MTVTDSLCKTRDRERVSQLGSVKLASFVLSLLDWP